MNLKKWFKTVAIVGTAVFLFAGASCSLDGSSLISDIIDSVTSSETSQTSEEQGVQYEIYLLAVSSGYDGTYEEWLASIRGEDGRTIELRLDETSGYLQWKYIDEDDSAWRNLLSLETLIGPAGNDGADGVNGQTPFIGENGNWWIGETDTGVKATGDIGATGNGIVSIEVVSTEGNLVTYKITFTDGTDFTYTVTNGTNGIDGQTPFIGQNGNWWVGETDTGVKATGDTGATGQTGNGISSIELISTVGNVDTYKITFTDGSFYSFSVTNGTNGENGQSAYEIYIASHPDYTGDEQQWLDDLINGELGNREVFTVTFDSNGGTGITSQQVEDGRKATRPEEPTRVGYTFEGWYINGDEKWVFGGFDVTENITLVAHWIANQYTITFDAKGGTLDSYTQTVTFDASFTLPIPVLAENYFMGWYDGTTKVESGIWKIEHNVTLSAYFIQEKYEVHYNLNYDEALEEVDLAIFGQNYTPFIPTRIDFVFNGWYDEEGNQYSGGIWSRESDLFLTAAWISTTYTITLDVNGGTMSEPTTCIAMYNETYTLPVPESDIAPFNGWYLDGVKLTNNQGISLAPWTFTTDKTLKAIYYIPISTVEELNNVRNDLGATYWLMNDIDLAGAEWTPIGTDTSQFTGTFNGQGFKIYNLKITTSQVYVGLFATNKGSISNLCLDNVSINVTGGLSSDIYAGAFIGINEGFIENLQALNGDFYVKKRGENQGYAGGIVGFQYSSITVNNLSSNLNVTGDNTNSTGGLIGYSSASTLTNSFNGGEVDGASFVGGLIGYGYETTIQNSENIGSVHGTSKDVGGLIGRGSSTVKIANSRNYGSINGASSGVGGLIGEGDYLNYIDDSFNEGSITGAEYGVGGLIGYSNWSMITNSHNGESVISYSQYAGGLVGYGNGTTINDSYNEGLIFGSGNVGGLLGFGSSATTISNSFNKSGIDGAYRVGGLVGHSTEASLTNSYNTGSVNGTSSYVGGLIGFATKATIVNSYNGGTIQGGEFVGGLIGVADSSLYLYYSVNLGDVASINVTTKVGGITGYLPSLNDIEQTFYSCLITANRVEVDCIAFGTKITDLSTLNLDFFTTTLGWSTDFWDFAGLDVTNSAYPTLIIPTATV